ncbi:MAG: hypothetical protein K8R21_00765 [Leptospira sp.]|nr:hypothetical protein [Leptospira sp.]
MRAIFILCVFTIGLFSQDKPNPQNKEPQPGQGSNQNQQNPGTNQGQPQPAQNADQQGVLDKEYYEYYFTTLPDAGKLQKEKLESNLTRLFKTEIQKRDYPACKELLPQIKPASLKYEKVTSDSIWVRGIKDVLGYIRYTDHMYVVKYQKYLAFISFELDPAKYIQNPFQLELIFKKENIFDAKSSEPHQAETK